MSVQLNVVVPAHNEAEMLPDSLPHLQRELQALNCAYEIVVVDNASTDGTPDIARDLGAVVVSEPHRQISRARNTGAAHAGGRYLLFVDADTWPSAALLARTLERLEAGAGGGGALVALDPAVPAIYQRGVSLWNGLARRLGWAAGCYVFARRDAFDALGGFDERLYAGDELVLSRRLRRWGRRHGRPFEVIGAPPVLTSGRKAHWFSLWRHLTTMLLVLCFPPALRFRRLLAFWYRRPSPTRDGGT